MSEIIRIPNIENYIQEIVNGELVLTPKNFKKFSDDDFINEQIARHMVLEYSFHGRRSEHYESEITEYPENDEQREFLKRQVGMIHQIKIMIKKRFVQRFGEKLWNDLRLEYGAN
jgi:hypothetical protein